MGYRWGDGYHGIQMEWGRKWVFGVGLTCPAGCHTDTLESSLIACELLSPINAWVLEHWFPKVSVGSIPFFPFMILSLPKAGPNLALSLASAWPVGASGTVAKECLVLVNVVGEYSLVDKKQACQTMLWTLGMVQCWIVQWFAFVQFQSGGCTEGPEVPQCLCPEATLSENN